KYIQYAKSQRKPVLTKGAADHIVATYSALRNDELEGNQRKTSPMTARTLETLIRLATAHAKARLSHRVEERDAEAAEAILRYALFKEVIEDERKKRRKVNRAEISDDDESSGESDDESDGGHASAPAQTANMTRRSQRSGTARTRNGTTPNGTYADQDGEGDDDDEDLYTASPQAQRTNGRPTQTNSQMSVASSQPASQLITSQTDDSQITGGPVNITPARLRVFRSALGQLLNTPLFQNESADVEPLVEAVNSRVGREPTFEMAEASAALLEMQDRNEVMYSENDGIVYKI
ncbi:MAG: hypothetical protein L6R41_000636, partial [Letrouitia leprolyta]